MVVRGRGGLTWSPDGTLDHSLAEVYFTPPTSCGAALAAVPRGPREGTTTIRVAARSAGVPDDQFRVTGARLVVDGQVLGLTAADLERGASVEVPGGDPSFRLEVSWPSGSWFVTDAQVGDGTAFSFDSRSRCPLAPVGPPTCS